MTAPDRVVAVGDLLATEARVAFGEAANGRQDFVDGLAALDQDERDLIETMFREGARCALAMLLKRGLVELPDLLAAYEASS